MENSQIIELIRTLSEEETEQIRLFAALPSFNYGKMRALVGPFLDICLDHPWHEPQQTLEKKEVFAKLFPGQGFLEGKLEKVMVEAHKVVRTFLTLKHYLRAENEFQQGLDFSEAIRIRGLDHRYQQLLLKMQKLQAESGIKDERYFQNQFLLEYAIHNEECLHNKLKGDLNVPNVIHTLELHSHLNRLALLNRFLLQQKVAMLDVPETIKTVIEEYQVPTRFLEASASIRVNFEIFRLLRKDHHDPSDVRVLFDLLLLHEQDLSPESLREFYTYLRNLCVIIFNADAQNEEINFTLHELFKDNLLRGYLHYKGRLHSTSYLGVCNNALWVKNYDWALEFIEKYKLEVIDENETQDFYRLNMANYLFGVGRFSECLDFIPASSVSVTHLLQGKRLELKARYELKDELFSFKLDNFKMFLLRTSPKLLSEAQRQTNSDFANLLHQMFNSTPGDQKRAELIISRVQEKKQSAEWRWLLEKAKALKVG